MSRWATRRASAAGWHCNRCRLEIHTLLLLLLLAAIPLPGIATDPPRVASDAVERLVDIPISGNFKAMDEASWGSGVENDAEREELERCLAAAEGMPPLYPLKDYRQQLFPWFERSVIPSSLQEWLALANNSDVAAATRSLGVRYWFLWNTRDRTEPTEGAIFCGAGPGGAGCFGLAWRERKSAYHGLLIDVYRARVVDFPEAEVTGHTIIPAFILPIPLVAQTPALACHKMAGVLARRIRADAAAQ
jgi:hypothetical protein